MRRAAPTLPVTPTMLRHFAVVTLLATASLAMFASGENKSALLEAQKAQSARGGGTWGTSPQKRADAAAPRTAGGLQLASGTRLQQSNNYDEPEDIRSGQEVLGDVRNLDPQYRTLPQGSLAGPSGVSGASAALAAAPPVIKRDPSGIPVPPMRAGQGNPPSNARPAPPRQATKEDIDRMMEASRARAAKGNGPAGGGADEDATAED
jgi:hypothetical protein